jgi:cytochrome b561
VTKVKQYHPFLIVLHWLLAIAIVGLFFMGAFVLDEMKNELPGKVPLLQLHVLGGVVILLLTIMRLIVRLKTAIPDPVKTNSPLMDKLARLVHYALYLFSLLATLSGLALAINSHLLDILFRHIGTLPADFEDYAAHEVHNIMAIMLMSLALLHVAGALKHQFLLKNRLFSRMSLAKEREK